MPKCTQCGEKLSIFERDLIGIDKICLDCKEANRVASVFGSVLTPENGKAFICTIRDPGALNFAERMNRLTEVGIGHLSRDAAVVLQKRRFSIHCSAEPFDELHVVGDFPWEEIQSWTSIPRSGGRLYLWALAKGAAAGAGLGAAASVALGFGYWNQAVGRWGEDDALLRCVYVGFALTLV